MKHIACLYFIAFGLHHCKIINAMVENNNDSEITIQRNVGKTVNMVDENNKKSQALISATCKAKKPKEIDQ